MLRQLTVLKKTFKDNFCYLGKDGKRRGKNFFFFNTVVTSNLESEAKKFDQKLEKAESYSDFMACVKEAIIEACIIRSRFIPLTDKFHKKGLFEQEIYKALEACEKLGLNLNIKNQITLLKNRLKAIPEQLEHDCHWGWHEYTIEYRDYTNLFPSPEKRNSFIQRRISQFLETGNAQWLYQLCIDSSFLYYRSPTSQINYFAHYGDGSLASNELAKHNNLLEKTVNTRGAAILVSFVRANADSALRYSILPLIKTIVELSNEPPAGDPTNKTAAVKMAKPS